MSYLSRVRAAARRPGPCVCYRPAPAAAPAPAPAEPPPAAPAPRRPVAPLWAVVPTVRQADTLRGSRCGTPRVSVLGVFADAARAALCALSVSRWAQVVRLV